VSVTLLKRSPSPPFHTCAHSHTHRYTHIHTHAHAYAQRHAHMRAYTDIHTRTHACIYRHIHMHAHTRPHSYTNIQTSNTQNPCIHTHARTHAQLICMHKGLHTTTRTHIRHHMYTTARTRIHAHTSHMQSHKKIMYKLWHSLTAPPHSAPSALTSFPPRRPLLLLTSRLPLPTRASCYRHAPPATDRTVMDKKKDGDEGDKIDTYLRTQNQFCE